MLAAAWTEICDVFLSLSAEDRGRILAAFILSCLGTAALLYSLPIREGRRSSRSPASFFLIGEITSKRRLWGVCLLSALPMWIIFFAVALAAPAAFEEAKRLSRVEFGRTISRAVGDEVWAAVERVLNDLPTVIDPSLTAIFVICLLLPHAVAGILYYRNIVCNFFAIEQNASAHASMMADALLKSGQKSDVTDRAYALQTTFANYLKSPCPIPPELAEADSWRLIIAYQVLYCVKGQVRHVGVRRAVEDFSKKINAVATPPQPPLPKLDFWNVLVGIVIFAALSAMYVFFVPQFSLFLDFLPDSAWPEATPPGRLGVATSIVQNSFSIFIPFIIGLYRQQSLTVDLKRRIEHSTEVRAEYWHLFRQTAALQIILSLVMGVSVSSIRYAFRDVLAQINERQIDLHPFAFGNLAYLIIAAFVPVLMMYFWMFLRGVVSGRERIKMGSVWFIIVCGVIFLLTQLALEVILLQRGSSLGQSFWHHFFLGASLTSFLLLALLTGATRATANGPANPKVNQ